MLTLLGAIFAAFVSETLLYKIDPGLRVPIVLLAPLMIAGVLALITGLVLLGCGVGVPVWRRWAPSMSMLALVVWCVVGEGLFKDRSQALFFGSAIGVSLCWLAGLSLQLAVVAVTSGVPARVARTRASRFLKATRLMLFIPAVLMWVIAIGLYTWGDVVWAFAAPVLLMLQGAGIVLVLWVLLAAVHWLRLIRFLRPPRILPP